MPMLMREGGGEYSPYIKYNAKSGRFEVRIEGMDGEFEVPTPRMAFDFANHKTGWIEYAEGGPPNKVWHKDGERVPKPEQGKFKEGFEVMVYCTDMVQGTMVGLREFSSTANVVKDAILTMYNGIFESQVGANPGKIPVFKCVRTNKLTGKFGASYQPVFELDMWVERSSIPVAAEEWGGVSESSTSNPVVQDDQSASAYVEDDIPF